MWKSFGKNTLCHALTPEKETLSSAMVHEYPDCQFILHAFAGSSGSLEDDHFEPMKRSKRAMVSPIDLVSSKIHQAKAHVFSDSVLCVGGSSMCDPSSKFEGRWVGSQFQRRRIKHFKRHQRSILRVRFQRQSWYYLRRSNSIFRRLSTAYLGQECVPETYTQRILFMAIMSELEVTDKPHKNTTCASSRLTKFVATQNASGQGAGISVGPDSSNMQ